MNTVYTPANAQSANNIYYIDMEQKILFCVVTTIQQYFKMEASVIGWGTVDVQAQWASVLHAIQGNGRCTQTDT